MMRRPARHLIATTALATSLLVACTQQPAGRRGAAGAEAMKDMTGGSCSMLARTDIAPDPAAPAPVYLYCGSKGDRPTGAVAALVPPLKLPDAEDARRAMLVKAAAESSAGRDAALRMGCSDGSWIKTADGLDLLIKPCSLYEGGWPQILVIGQVGKFLMQAEGLPGMMPVLETAILKFTPYQPPEGTQAFGGPDAARGLLEQALGRDLHMVGAADYVRFGELTEAARLASSRKDFRAAEDAYREALTIQERAFGQDSPALGSTLMSLALEVSNRGRFEESAALFRRAEPIIQRSPNPSDRARFDTYMAYDAANAGRFADALPYAREATSIWRQLVGDDAPTLDNLGGGDDEARTAKRGELAHSLNVEAAMALRTGALADAEAAGKEAMTILGEEHGLPPWWRPEILVTMGEIYAEQGRLNEAEQSFRGALIFQQRLFGDTAPTAATLMSLGRVYARQELYPESLRSYEFAIKILDADEIARGQVSPDQIAPLVTAANAVIQRQPDQRARLDALTFHAAQLMGNSVADQTISRASARLAARDPAIEKLVHDMQEASGRATRRASSWPIRRRCPTTSAAPSSRPICSPRSTGRTRCATRSRRSSRKSSRPMRVWPIRAP
jgi:tetratricopeptide (TPR) repeat protein